jgi:hypothetical protein
MSTPVYRHALLQVTMSLAFSKADLVVQYDI